MFTTGNELLAVCWEHSCSISQAVLMREEQLSGRSEKQIRQELREVLSVMRASSRKAVGQPVETVGSMIQGDSQRLSRYLKRGRTLCGDSVNTAMMRALSSCEVNASMGRICAAPTAGSCGIVPAVLFTCAEKFFLNDRQLQDALLTASGIGVIIAQNATVSGAEGGCQAECGAAAAMAAAAAVQAMGGAPEASLHAAAISLKNVMGLVCDPIAGLVESPCAKRNASGAVNAMVSADLAMAGIRSAIPFDEVVDAMYRVGRMLPTQLRETALGGVAATPTGKKIARSIFGEQRVAEKV